MKSSDRTSALLFVYGSLKRGRANHHELRAAKYVSETHTVPDFALRVVAGYPSSSPRFAGDLGELYRIASSALPALDAFEGERYVRHEVELAER